jgi:hypothetical protein
LDVQASEVSMLRLNRDKASLDIFWLREESLEESDNLPDCDVLAQEIVEELEAALNNSAKSPVRRWSFACWRVAEIRNGDVLEKNRVRHRHCLKP